MKVEVKSYFFPVALVWFGGVRNHTDLNENYSSKENELCVFGQVIEPFWVILPVDVKST